MDSKATWVKTTGVRGAMKLDFEEHTLMCEGKIVGKVTDIHAGWQAEDMSEPIFKWQGWFYVASEGSVFPTHNYDTAEDVKEIAKAGHALGQALGFWEINEWEKGEWQDRVREPETGWQQRDPNIRSYKFVENGWIFGEVYAFHKGGFTGWYCSKEGMVDLPVISDLEKAKWVVENGYLAWVANRKENAQ